MSKVKLDVLSVLETLDCENLEIHSGIGYWNCFIESSRLILRSSYWPLWPSTAKVRGTKHSVDQNIDHFSNIDISFT